MTLRLHPRYVTSLALIAASIGTALADSPILSGVQSTPSKAISANTAPTGVAAQTGGAPRSKPKTPRTNDAAGAAASSAPADAPHPVRRATPTRSHTASTSPLFDLASDKGDIAPTKRPTRLDAGTIIGGGTPGVRPRSSFHDPRLVSFPYDANKIFPIIARGNKNTFIKFAPGETISGVYFEDGCVVFEHESQGGPAAAGGPHDDAEDSCDSSWAVLVQKSRDTIVVKPDHDGIDNTAEIRTNLRTYELAFEATSDAQYYMRVTWKTRDWSGAASLADQPSGQASAHSQIAQSETMRAPIQSGDIAPKETGTHAAIDIAHLNTRYRIDGHADFRPELVMDDGKRTWLRLPDGIDERPPLFAIDDNGAVELVQYYPGEGPSGSYLWFEGTRKKLLLKLGDDEVHITRSKS